MASWPTPAEIRELLRIDPGAGVGDEVIQRAIDASISYTARRCGYDDPTDPEFVPTDQLVAAVTLRTMRAHRRYDSPLGVIDSFELGAVYPTKIDPDYEAMLVGERRGWGLA